jgi:apolipoprotein N-acyltransferase
MSFRYYGFPWGIPIGVLSIAMVYGVWFYAIAKLAYLFGAKNSIWIRALLLLIASYIHPFGFDWFKPELMFVESYIGIQKWQFGVVLMAISLSIYYRRAIYLPLILLAYNPSIAHITTPPPHISLINTDISIDDKWNSELLSMQINLVKDKIKDAIGEGKKIIIFPESILPIYLNREPELLEYFRDSSKSIAIVVGALSYEDKIPRNSTYIFDNSSLLIANKVILVPFGESNPLPDWLGKIVNDIFYDGAVDYMASSKISDYTIDGITYRNAICYEGCSETLYIDNPKKMIIISNNNWFTPSIQPTEQRLLLEYYSRKYGTTIYHSINGSMGYVVSSE